MLSLVDYDIQFVNIPLKQEMVILISVFVTMVNCKINNHLIYALRSFTHKINTVTKVLRLISVCFSLTT